MHDLLRMNAYLAVSALIFLTQPSYGSYDCLCSYAEEIPVFPSPDSSHIPLGYMYEFDCKPFSTPRRSKNGYFIIQYEHKIGYVETGDLDSLKEQTCAGSIPDMDAVATTHSPEPITSNYSHINTATVVPNLNTTTTTSSGDIINSTSTIPPHYVEVSTIRVTNSTGISTSVSNAAPLTNTTEVTTVKTILSNGTNPDEITMTHAALDTVTTTEFSSPLHTKGTDMTSSEIIRSMNPTNPTSTFNTIPSFLSTSTSILNSIISTSPRTISTPTGSLFSRSSIIETKSVSQTTTKRNDFLNNMNVTESTTGEFEMSSIHGNNAFSETPTTTTWNNTETAKPTSNYSTSPLNVSTRTTFTSLPSTTVAMSSPTTTLSTTSTSQTPVQTTPTPITWPRGTYGLMEAAQGCPDDGHVTWSEGWRYQDTEGALIGSGNTYTWGIANYMKGVFTRNNIKTYFCMKKQHVPNSYDHDWPAGSYCILKYGHCPKGFKSGSIFWDDVVIGNHDDKGGTLPEGNFGTETEIFYCCRGDGPVSTGIVLPTTKPFILLRYTETCQTVKGMSAYDIFIYWDDQNLFNSDHSTGMHPYEDGDRKNHKLHFCYYSSPSGTGGEPGFVGR